MITEVEEISQCISWPDDPIFFDLRSRRWYWYDESYLPEGPYDSEHDARIDCMLYCWCCLENRTFGVPPHDMMRLSNKMYTGDYAESNKL